MSAKIAYRPDIDGLRTIAVGAVVAYHAFPALVPGGFVGVDIFFVISGFLITGILVREHERTGRIDLAEFYARRIRRLLPALLLVVAATLALGLLLTPATGELQSLARSALAALFFASNIFFALQPSGYFAQAAETYPLLHTWTLAVEEQFYIVWPLLIPLTAWIAGKVGMGRRRGLWTLFVAMLVGSFALGLIGTQLRPTWAFYLTPFRGWEFAIGAMLSLAIRGDAPRWRHGATALAALGLGLIATALWCLDHDTPFPGWAALLPTLGAAALLAAGAIAPGNPVARTLAAGPATYVGKLSYGWYLWHWPLLAFVRADALGEPRTIALVGAVIVSLLLSALSYHVLETPIRHRRFAIVRTTAKTLIAGLAMLIIAGTAAVATILIANQRLSASPYLAAIKAAGSSGVVPGMSLECLNARTDVRDLLPAERCTSGDRDARRIALLIGDSHAMHFMPMLDRWGRRAHVAILNRTKGGCRPLEGSAVTIGLPRTAANLQECGRFRDAVFAEFATLAKTGRLAAVVLAGRWPDPEMTRDFTAPTPGDLAGFDRGLQRIEAIARHANVSLVIVQDTPFFPYDVPKCLARRTPAFCSMPRADAERLNDYSHERIMRFAHTHHGVRTLDPGSLLCNATTCSPIRDGVVMFIDPGHLSSVGSAALAAPLRNDLDAAILAP